MKKTSFLFCAAMLVASAAARAQDTSSPEYVEAKQRLQEGKTLYGQGNIDGARLKFEQACAVLKTPACQRALGLSQFYTKRYLEALGNLQKALDDPALTTEQRKEVTDLRQQAYDKTGHVEVHAPAGGHVRVDDTIDAGNAPLSDVVHVTVGTHVVSVSVDDKTERKNVDCSEGKVIKVDFSDRFPQMGNEGNGNGNGNGNQNPPPEEHKTMFPPPTGAIVTGVIGLVGIGLGIGFGVASSNANSENVTRGGTAGGVCSMNPNAQVCLDGNSTRNAQQTDAVISTVGYIAGGVALVTALVWWIAAPRKIVDHKARIVPQVGPHTAGASFTFSF